MAPLLTAIACGFVLIASAITLAVLAGRDCYEDEARSLINPHDVEGM